MSDVAARPEGAGADVFAGLGLPASRWTTGPFPLHWVDFGGPEDASPVVCLHGLGGSLLNWLPVAPLLAREHRVIALDLPGHGLSVAAAARSRLPAVLDELDTALDELVGGPAVLLGNSMGGTLAILQAARRPESVSGLALVAPAVPPTLLSPPEKLVVAAFAAYAVPGVGERLVGARRGHFTEEQVVAQTLRLVCAHPERVPEDVLEASRRLARHRMGDASLDAGFLAAARSLLWTMYRPRRYVAAMRAVRAPVLVLSGGGDRLVPPAALRRTVRRLPAWELRVATDVGHVPQLEAPEWVAAEVERWHRARVAAA